MNAEIITIGNEILSGEVLDTNSHFISNKLLECGVNVTRITSVGDFQPRIKEAFENVVGTYVIATGGLGPTCDDVTKKAFAEFLNKKLVINQKILSNIKERFAKRNLKMSQSNVEQAMIPEGVTLLENRFGTAPGLYYNQNKRHFFLLPGVPTEMRNMMEERVIPILKGLTPGENICRLVIKTTGISESALFEKLKDLNQQGCLGFLPTFSGVNLKIITKGENAQKKAESLTRVVEERLGERIYGRDEEKLEEVVGRLLKERGLNVAVAESCTGGLISDKLTNVSGSSAYFERGIIAYSNKSKIETLGVPRQTIKRHGAVSAETARAMASGIRESSDAEIGLSITGIAGPTGGTKTKPVGLAFMGFSGRKGTFSRKCQFLKDRRTNKEKMAYAALDLLRGELQNYP